MSFVKGFYCIRRLYIFRFYSYHWCLWQWGWLEKPHWSRICGQWVKLNYIVKLFFKTSRSGGYIKPYQVCLEAETYQRTSVCAGRSRCLVTAKGTWWSPDSGEGPRPPHETGLGSRVTICCLTPWALFWWNLDSSETNKDWWQWGRKLPFTVLFCF